MTLKQLQYAVTVASDFKLHRYSQRARVSARAFYFLNANLYNTSASAALTASAISCDIRNP